MKLVHVPETTDVKFPPSEYRFNAPGTEIVGYTITVPHKEDITPISILEKTYKEGLYPNYETILNEIVPIKWEDNTIQIHIAEIDSCYRNIFLQWIPGRDEWIGIEEASWRPSEKYGLDSKYQGPFKLDEKYASKIITAFWLNHDDFFKSFKVSDAIKKSPETLEGMMTFENRTSRFLYLAEKGPTYYFDGLHESGLGDLEVSVCSDDVDKLHDECKSLVEIAKTVVKENSS
ncbi:MAG: hypothetical protein Q8O89_02200, partial [Nanoarchaeota archaeon]|nr:hypothetical protein [Nanoarchaeota archaeon]